MGLRQSARWAFASWLLLQRLERCSAMFHPFRYCSSIRVIGTRSRSGSRHFGDYKWKPNSNWIKNSCLSALPSSIGCRTRNSKSQSLDIRGSAMEAEAEDWMGSAASASAYPQFLFGSASTNRARRSSIDLT